MGVVNFLPIQDGTGDASPKNIRPIRAPLDIDGIGKVYGGSLDTVTGELVDGYKKVVITKVHGWSKQGTTGWYRTYDGLLPSGSSALNQNNKCFCNNLTKRQSQASTNFGIIFGYGGTNRVVVTGSQSEYPTSEALSTYLESIGTYYVIPVATTKTHHLTTAQLHQALAQLKAYFGGILPVANMTDIRRRIIMDTPHIVTPTPAELHTFSTNMVAPLKDCVIHFDPVQEGEGDPSPENVRNITGRTGMSLPLCGKNLLPLVGRSGLTYNASVGKQYTLGYLDDAVVSGNTISRDVDVWGNLGLVSVRLIPGDYHLKAEVNSTSLRYSLYVLDANYTVTRKLAYSASGTSGTVNRNITILEGEAYVAIYIASASTGSVSFVEPQLEFGSEATDFEQYRGNTNSIVWADEAGTLYGGTYNSVTGELRDTWHAQALTGDEPWAEYKGEYRFACHSNNGFPHKAKGQNNVICNKLDVGGYNSNYYVAVVGESANLFATVTDLKTYLAEQYANGTPVVISYERGIPIVYHLPPLNLKTLKGINNIWSNANGNIDLSYWTH